MIPILPISSRDLRRGRADRRAFWLLLYKNTSPLVCPKALRIKIANSSNKVAFGPKHLETRVLTEPCVWCPYHLGSIGLSYHILQYNNIILYWIYCWFGSIGARGLWGPYSREGASAAPKAPAGRRSPAPGVRGWRRAWSEDGSFHKFGGSF